MNETHGTSEVFAIIVGGGIGTDPRIVPNTLQPLLTEFKDIIPADLARGVTSHASKT